MLKAFSSFLVAFSKILSPDISWRKGQMFWWKPYSACVFPCQHFSYVNVQGLASHLSLGEVSLLKAPVLP